MALPSGKLIYENRSFKPRENGPKHQLYLENHYLNHSMNLMLPQCAAVSSEIMSIISEQCFSVLEDVPLMELVQEEFIEAFVKRGAVHMISDGTQIDTEDCVSVLPTGDLILNITRETYVELGLEGTPSIYHKKYKNKYVVKVPLKADYFKPEKKYYERVKWCLEKRPDLKFSFLVAWDPDDASISTSSLGHYFEKRRAYTNHECRLKASRRELRHLRTPKIDSKNSQESDENCSSLQLYEWLGGVMLGIDCDGKADGYVNTYSCPEPHTVYKDSITCTFRGLITVKSIRNVLDVLKQLVIKNNDGIPWAALTVHGFDDSPVSWKLQEHGFHISGDNSYTYIIFPDERYWLFKGYGKHDVIV